VIETQETLLWSWDEAAQLLLTLAVALERDPLLKGTQVFIVGQVPGTPGTREETEAFLDRPSSQRFAPALLESLTQNVAGTWTAARLLIGIARILNTATGQERTTMLNRDICDEAPHRLVYNGVAGERRTAPNVKEHEHV
jgi:hypothetical protein